MALAGRGRRICGLAAALVGVLVPASPAAAAQGTPRSGSKILTAAQVVKAFAPSGLKLFNPTAYVQPIPTLNPVNPLPGYTLGVTVYPTVSQATDAYRAIKNDGPAAGAAVARVKNVLVAVTLQGAAIGHRPGGPLARGRNAAAPPAMPAPVAASIARLQHDQ